MWNVQLCVGWDANCIVLWYIKYIGYSVFVCSVYTNKKCFTSHLYMYCLCSKCNTEQKRPKSLWWIEMCFFLHHSVLHWAHQFSTGSCECLSIWWFFCVIWKQNTILRRNNIYFFSFVCIVLRVRGLRLENVFKQSRKAAMLFWLRPDWGREWEWKREQKGDRGEGRREVRDGEGQRGPMATTYNTVS